MELRYLADMRDRGLSLKQAEELWRQHTALQSRPILFTPPGPLQRHPNTPRRYHR